MIDPKISDVLFLEQKNVKISREITVDFKRAMASWWQSKGSIGWL
jgi:hypothetical protein